MGVHSGANESRVLVSIQGPRGYESQVAAVPRAWGDRPDSHRLRPGPQPGASTTSASATAEDAGFEPARRSRADRRFRDGCRYLARPILLVGSPGTRTPNRSVQRCGRKRIHARARAESGHADKPTALPLELATPRQTSTPSRSRTGARRLRMPSLFPLSYRGAYLRHYAVVSFEECTHDK